MTNLAEIFKQALTNEVKARAFYRVAGEITHDDASRMLFIELAGLEENHARELVDMAKEIAFEPAWDPTAFLDSLESHTHASVSDHELNALLDGDMKAVLGIAREMEHASMTAYRTLSEKSTDDEARDYFTKLAQQEAGHLAEVERMALALETPEAERTAL